MVFVLRRCFISTCSASLKDFKHTHEKKKKLCTFASSSESNILQITNSIQSIFNARGRLIYVSLSFFLCVFSAHLWRNAVESVGLPTQSYQVFSKTSERLLRQRAEATEERLGHPSHQCAWKLQRTLPSHACQGEWCLHFSRRHKSLSRGGMFTQKFFSN